MKDVVILGSTGSIGTQALDLVRANPDRFRVVGLTAGGSNPDLFEQQVAEFGPVELIGEHELIRAAAAAGTTAAAIQRRRSRLGTELSSQLGAPSPWPARRRHPPIAARTCRVRKVSCG